MIRIRIHMMSGAVVTFDCTSFKYWIDDVGGVKRYEVEGMKPVSPGESTPFMVRPDRIEAIVRSYPVEEE